MQKHGVEVILLPYHKKYPEQVFTRDIGFTLGQTMISIPFKEKFLHLDYVFNVISPDVALIYPDALTKEDIKLFSSKYDFIEVSHEEQFTLGTNVLCIGNKRILSLPVNKQVNKQLRSHGFEVIEVDISEIIKSGGSFRCCTLPILRGMP